MLAAGRMLEAVKRVDNLSGVRDNNAAPDHRQRRDLGVKPKAPAGCVDHAAARRWPGLRAQQASGSGVGH